MIKTMMLILIMMHKKYDDIYISFILFQDGYSAVHLAAMYSREDTIRHLVHKKGDINAIGGVGDVISLSRVSRKFGFRFRRWMINHLFILFLNSFIFLSLFFFFYLLSKGRTFVGFPTKQVYVLCFFFFLSLSLLCNHVCLLSGIIYMINV